MKPRLAAVLALAATWVVLSPAAFADPPKEAELLKRIEQLEKRVTELEKVVNQPRPPGKEQATETEKKPVGNWVIVDADKKTAADKKLVPWTDLKFTADGTCALVQSGGGMVVRGAKYQVTQIGSVTEIAMEWGAGGGAKLGWGCRIASVTDKELVLEYATSPDTWVKVRYTRVRVK
jgi:hypothetical protein